MQIAERRAARDAVLKHVGTARAPADLAVLRATARERLHLGQGDLDMELSSQEVPGRPGVITDKTCAVLRHPERCVCVARVSQASPSRLAGFTM